MSYLDRYQSQRRHNLQNTMTSTTTKTTSFRSQRTEHREIKMEMEGSSYGSHDMQAFYRRDHPSMSESRQWYSGTSHGIYYSSFDQPSLERKMIGGGRAMTEDWRAMGHPTMSADRDDESSVVVVQKEKPAFVTPEWMEERPSPAETRHRHPDVLDISILLKYPSGYVPKRNAPDPRKMQYESTIRPEVAKRDNSAPVLRDEDFEDDDDEFEEEIVVVNVLRKPLWRKGLAKPSPELPKVGVPIHHLLQLPTRRAKREPAPDRFFTDEKIESVQRPPMNYEAVNLEGIWKTFDLEDRIGNKY